MKRLALLLCLLGGQAWASSPDVGFYVRQLDTPRDIDALNSNFRTLSDAIRRLNALIGAGASASTAQTIFTSTSLPPPLYVSGGLFGVGTANPGSLLEVAGTFQASGNGGVGLVVDGNGNVGIGTPSPAYNLEVSGTFHATGGSAFDATLSVGGAVTAASFAGDGSALTALNASQLTSGTIPNARQDSSSVTLQGNAFNGASQLVQLTAATKYPALDGSLILRVSSIAVGSVFLSAAATDAVFGGTITANASQFSGTGTGTNPLTLKSSSVTLQGNSFNAPGSIILNTAQGVFASSNTVYVSSGNVYISTTTRNALTYFYPALTVGSPQGWAGIDLSAQVGFDSFLNFTANGTPTWIVRADGNNGNTAIEAGALQIADSLLNVVSIAVHPGGTVGIGNDAAYDGTRDTSLTVTGGSAYHFKVNDSNYGTIVAIDTAAHLSMSGSNTPSIAGCGTGATNDGNDITGTINLGTTIGTCVVTFVNRYNGVLPRCFCNNTTTPAHSCGWSTAATTITLGGTVANSEHVQYLCDH